MSDATRKAYRNAKAREQERLYAEERAERVRELELRNRRPISGEPLAPINPLEPPTAEVLEFVAGMAADGLIELEPRKLARNSDVETSHNAIPATRAAQLRRVLEQHEQASRWHPPGLTDDEVSVILGVDVWRRCSELREQGMLEWYLNAASGEPATRVARSGRRGRVSVITDTGRAALEH